MRERVEEALRVTGYVPNAQAKAMRTAKAGAIGIATTEIQNPFLPYLVDALTAAARDAGLTTIVWNDPEPSMPMALAGVNSGAVDGILATAARRDVVELEKLRERGFPVVLCNRAPENTSIDVVTSDHFGSATESASFLVERGKKDIAAVFGPRDTFASEQRRIGFSRALAERGIGLEPHRLAEGPITYDTGYRAVDRFLSNSIPDAIYCSSDVIAFGVLDRLRDLNVRVPEDTFVTAVDGLPMSGWRAFDLTTRAQNIDTVARASIDILAARIAGEGGEARRVLVPTTLIERGSTA